MIRMAQTKHFLKNVYLFLGANPAICALRRHHIDDCAWKKNACKHGGKADKSYEYANVELEFSEQSEQSANAAADIQRLQINQQYLLFTI